MDANLRQNCKCGDTAAQHEGETIDDDGICHVRVCGCEAYEADPFDVGPQPWEGP